MTKLWVERALCWQLLTTVLACGASDDTLAVQVAQYTSPIVLLVSPDSLELANLRAVRGDDFYVVADDAMWYRALTYDLLDSLGLRHAEVGRGEAEFMVRQKRELVSWEETPYSWFVVVYDGEKEPTVVPDVDIRGALADVLRPQARLLPNCRLAEDAELFMVSSESSVSGVVAPHLWSRGR